MACECTFHSDVVFLSCLQTSILLFCSFSSTLTVVLQGGSVTFRQFAVGDTKLSTSQVLVKWRARVPTIHNPLHYSRAWCHVIKTAWETNFSNADDVFIHVCLQCCLLCPTTVVDCLHNVIMVVPDWWPCSADRCLKEKNNPKGFIVADSFSSWSIILQKWLSLHLFK